MYEKITRLAGCIPISYSTSSRTASAEREGAGFRHQTPSPCQYQLPLCGAGAQMGSQPPGGGHTHVPAPDLVLVDSSRLTLPRPRPRPPSGRPSLPRWTRRRPCSPSPFPARFPRALPLPKVHDATVAAARARDDGLDARGRAGPRAEDNVDGAADPADLAGALLRRPVVSRHPCPCRCPAAALPLPPSWPLPLPRRRRRRRHHRGCPLSVNSHYVPFIPAPSPSHPHSPDVPTSSVKSSC